MAIISVISYLTCNCSALPYFFSMLFFKCRWLSTSVFFLLLLLLFLFSFWYFFLSFLIGQPWSVEIIRLTVLIAQL